MQRWLIIGTMAAALVGAAPAGAFHHVRVPANECGESANAGGANPTASTEVAAHSQANDGNLPIPPAGTPAEGASPVVGPGATCPAPNR